MSAQPDPEYDAAEHAYECLTCGYVTEATSHPDAARERGLTRATLHAQVRVRGFYERLGYVATGDSFDRGGIPHVAMERTL
jgi:transposase